MSDGMISYVLYGKEDLRPERRTVPEVKPGQVLIKVRRMGICGSDVHYFIHGYCGVFIPKRPFILGHEFAGEVAETGAGVKGVSVCDRVAVDPSYPCSICRFCRTGRYNLCDNMKYLGSASTDPHVDGAFCEYIAMPAANCYVLPDKIDYGEAALLEPLSVATHAVMRAGSVSGKSVLIAGGGTIGQLVLLVVRAFGSAHIVLSDIREAPRKLALNQGADHVLDATTDSMKGQALGIVEDGFDIIFEVSGSPAALGQAIDLVRRAGTIIQVGTLPSEVELPANMIMVKELNILGSFRFANVFSTAINLIASGRINLRPLITHTFPFGNFLSAMNLACGKENIIKVQVEA
ncbi:MAG: L-idonate 5-dehydrogenase [Ignavibacteria bacterium]|nr:L-idonate 5-dehydrogenase [Ignavibacteria bacterium]